jgi:hypothetical protein
VSLLVWWQCFQGEFPQLVMVTRDSRGMGWSASILRGRCDEGMTPLRCASMAYKENNRVANAAIGAEAAGILQSTYAQVSAPSNGAPARRRRQSVVFFLWSGSSGFPWPRRGATLTHLGKKKRPGMGLQMPPGWSSLRKMLRRTISLSRSSDANCCL